jgi:hypothetical protein
VIGSPLVEGAGKLIILFSLASNELVIGFATVPPLELYETFGLMRLV